MVWYTRAVDQDHRWSLCNLAEPVVEPRCIARLRAPHLWHQLDEVVRRGVPVLLQLGTDGRE